MRGAKPFMVVSTDTPAIDDVAAPEWLEDDARDEWNRVAPVLIRERRTLTDADLSSLANYCVAAGLVVQMSRVIKSEGATFMSKNGPRKHPAIAIRSDAMTQARLLASELGLTPVSRSRSRAQPAPAGDGSLFGLFDRDF